MKTTFLLCMLFVFIQATTGKVQTSDKQVIASAGMVMSYGDSSVESTIDGPLTHTLNGGGANSAQLSNSFHQGILSITQLIEIKGINLRISPNTKQGKVQLQFKEGQKNIPLSIYASDGRTLYTETINGFQTEIDFSSYAEGTYYIRLDNINAYKIIKKK